MRSLPVLLLFAFCAPDAAAIEDQRQQQSRADGGKVPRLVEALDPYKLFGAGNVPDGPYAPLDRAGRWRHFKQETFAGGVAFARPFFSAIRMQVLEQPEAWSGFPGYMTRAGSRIVFYAASNSISAPISALMGYERRYYPCYCSGTWRRIGHAILFQVLTVDEKGRKTLNFPKIAGSYAGEVIAYSTYPGQLGVRAGLRNSNGYFYWGWWSNLLSEFSPDLSRLVRRIFN